MRQAKVSILIQGLSALRIHTLTAFEHYQRANALEVPLKEEFNPPLWELGHLAWFQEYWCGRNQQRDLGVAQDIHHLRLSSKLPQADLWYDSTRVAHDLRWSLPLLPTAACFDFMQQTLDETLNLLEQERDNSPALYFYWLALQHEAMHLEASTYMAQSLGIPFTTPWASATPHTNSNGAMRELPRTRWSMGMHWQSNAPQTFCFDNEVGQRVCDLDVYSIALEPVTWGQYMHFIEATGHRLPLYVRWAQFPQSSQSSESAQLAQSRPLKHGYEINHFGIWSPLDIHACARHISWDDAQAYCSWAQCRLPTEAEWDRAARTLTDFKWGDVWEWTADAFEPFESFTPHPYEEYSAPWFGSRKVLRGAAWATHPYLKDLSYRNFFTPDRRDIYAGFRICA